MKKDAYYFSHDSNARSDEKIIKLRTKHGWEGYGLYWAIIEKLRETKDYKLDKDYEAIAFDLHSQCERIKEIIENFGLFIVNDKNFFSKSLLIRMKAYEDKKDKARNSANIRWNKGMRTHSERNANVMLSKVKESKVKNILQTEVCEEFNSDEYITKLMNDKQKHIQLIGKYASTLKMKFPSQKAISAFIARHVKSAKELSEYKDEEIRKTVEYIIDQKWLDKWTFETVLKYIGKINE